VIPFTTTAGAAIPDPCLRPEVPAPQHVHDYVGQRVDAVLLENAARLQERSQGRGQT
jgi:hypothetical protein